LQPFFDSLLYEMLDTMIPRKWDFLIGTWLKELVIVRLADHLVPLSSAVLRTTVTGRDQSLWISS